MIVVVVSEIVIVVVTAEAVVIAEAVAAEVEGNMQMCGLAGLLRINEIFYKDGFELR
jgi:hypothetical protein